MASEYRATVELRGDLVFAATGDSGQTIVLDAAGSDQPSRGPGPMEVLLLALGGCDGVNVVEILRKMRQDVRGYQVNLRAERRDRPPRIFTAIEVEHVVRGRDVEPRAVQRAIELSAKYCAVGATIRAVASIAESYRILDDAAGGEVARGTIEAATAGSYNGSAPRAHSEGQA